MANMANWGKFGWSANKSNRVRFYGKVVLSGGKTITKVFRNTTLLHAIAWVEEQAQTSANRSDVVGGIWYDKKYTVPCWAYSFIA